MLNFKIKVNSIYLLILVLSKKSAGFQAGGFSLPCFFHTLAGAR